MYKIESHPILEVPEEDLWYFEYEGARVAGQKGQSIAAALHQAGLRVHHHSLKDRPRSMECGIGKCGACEMLVDGHVRRICITKVDGVREVRRIEEATLPPEEPVAQDHSQDNSFLASRTKTFSPEKKVEKVVYRTAVAIVGAGPAGLAVREELRKAGVDNLVIDNNSAVGGQFRMQTHQFFFFEKEKKFGGMRCFDIAGTLAGVDNEGIMLNCVVWDILEGKRLAVKNIKTQEVFYVDADVLVVAAGALPFMPPFKNDDLPGVYTAAVVQRMMNTEFTLLGKNILTVGAGNIGYLTSYQAMQAGANVKAIIEAMPHEGGFPVQANRVRRLGIPILTGYTLVEAIPNEDRSGVVGAIIARCENFKPVPGPEVRLDGIDWINISTGLLPDGQLLKKGERVFGRACHGVGDAVRIGEGTSAVLRGRQCALEIMQDLGLRPDYNRYLAISKEYIDSQQRPVRIQDEPRKPDLSRTKPFVIADCLYGFACNPCSFACKQEAIKKTSTSVTPRIDYDKCIGCMECVSQCPGLAIFGYNPARGLMYFPYEFDEPAVKEVFLVDDNGAKLGTGEIERIIRKPNKTNIAVVKAVSWIGAAGLTDARGFIPVDKYPEPLQLTPCTTDGAATYVCHCEDVSLESLLKLLEGRKSITAQELKHISRLGMGPCRGSRCLPRAKQILRANGIEVTGDFTPRGPMANLVEIGGLVPRDLSTSLEMTGSSVISTGGDPSSVISTGGEAVVEKSHLITAAEKTEAEVISVGALVAGGGMAGTATFRYLAQEGLKPVLVNNDHGSSWRCIAGGRPAFSVPALAEIARGNLDIFRELQAQRDIDLKMTRYVNFVHDEATYKSLDASRAWSDAFMIDKKDFPKYISPYLNPNLDLYSHALISNDCWQASPGKTIDTVRRIGIGLGGEVLEDTELVDVALVDGVYYATVKLPGGRYRRYKTRIFVNAMGAGAEKFASMLGIETGLYPVRHQAFITKRLPLMGPGGDSLDMLIDRRHYKGFSAVYGQQLASTGQIIGCASPASDSAEAGKDLKVNTQAFLEIAAEVFCEWIPRLRGTSFQATWAGYYTEPRYIVDPALGLFTGMRGHGFMLSQYIGKLYVDSLMGRPVPDFFHELALGGNGLDESAFK
ncbi:MAG: FAD-dependent oxidoreductase [Bacteroidales bacterium]|nr:FAD-dependent oxidoreductase [Bacteroidales bacterium]